MLARALISREQYEAGCQYATLYFQTVAPTTVSVASHCRRLLAAGGGGQEIEEEVIAQFAGVDGLSHTVLRNLSDRTWQKTLSLTELERGGQYTRVPDDSEPI